MGRRGGLADAPSGAWRKELYEPQPFPDNHTGDEFLAELLLNSRVSKRSYWKARFRV